MPYAAGATRPSAIATKIANRSGADTAAKIAEFPGDDGKGTPCSAGPGGGEAGGRFRQRLGQDPHVCEHGHEVRIACPARDDVLVHVVDDPGAGDPPEVPAEVVPLRVIGGFERG